MWIMGVLMWKAILVIWIVVFETSPSWRANDWPKLTSSTFTPKFLSHLKSHIFQQAQSKWNIKVHHLKRPIFHISRNIRLFHMHQVIPVNWKQFWASAKNVQSLHENGVCCSCIRFLVVGFDPGERDNFTRMLALITPSLPMRLPILSSSVWLVTKSVQPVHNMRVGEILHQRTWGNKQLLVVLLNYSVVSMVVRAPYSQQSWSSSNHSALF